MDMLHKLIIRRVRMRKLLKEILRSHIFRGGAPCHYGITGRLCKVGVEYFRIERHMRFNSITNTRDEIMTTTFGLKSEEINEQLSELHTPAHRGQGFQGIVNGDYSAT